MQDVSVSDIELREYYDDNVSNYGVTEERSANHILVRVEADATDEVVETARQKAVGYRDRAVQGESFEEIARQFSEDEGSKANGGRPAIFAKELWPPVRRTGVRHGGGRDQRARTDGLWIPHYQTARHTTGRHQVLRGGAGAGGEGIAPRVCRTGTLGSYRTARRSHLRTAGYAGCCERRDGPYRPETDWISRSGGTGIFADTRLIAAAFSEDVLQDSLNSDVIELDDDRLIVLRALDYRDQSLRPLNEVTEAITEELLLAEIKTRAAELGRVSRNSWTMVRRVMRLLLRTRLNGMLVKMWSAATPILTARCCVKRSACPDHGRTVLLTAECRSATVATQSLH